MSSPPYVCSPKDPADVEDYGINISAWLLDGETVEDTSVTSDSEALVITGDTVVDGVLRWRASGGTPGVNHKVTVTITASSARVAERTVIIPVRQL